MSGKDKKIERRVHKDALLVSGALVAMCTMYFVYSMLAMFGLNATLPCKIIEYLDNYDLYKPDQLGISNDGRVVVLHVQVDSWWAKVKLHAASRYGNGHPAEEREGYGLEMKNITYAREYFGVGQELVCMFNDLRITKIGFVYLIHWDERASLETAAVVNNMRQPNGENAQLVNMILSGTFLVLSGGLFVILVINWHRRREHDDDDIPGPPPPTSYKNPYVEMTEKPTNNNQ